MNVPFARWVRSVAVRVLDATVDHCFNLRDRLEPPPPVPEGLTVRVMARIAAEPVYQPTLIDAHAANLVEHYGDRSLFILPFVESHQVHFVLDSNYGAGFRQVPPS